MAKKRSSSNAKTTRQMAAVKSVVKEGPPIVIQQAPETIKPQDVNWNVIGFLSAATTLGGTGLLFMLGWAYEANWFGYFGVSIMQISMPPQQILIQSIPSAVETATWLIIAIIVYLQMLQYLPQRNDSEAASSLTRGKYFGLWDWVWVLCIAIALASLYIAGRVYVELYKIYQISFFDVYEVLYSFYLVLTPILAIFGAFIGLWLLRISQVLIKILLKRQKVVLKFFRLSRVLSPALLLVFLVSSLVSLSIADSAMIGLYDAARGKRGSGGWKIQSMLLISQTNFNFLGSISQTCDASGCVSGPFGLIGENANSFILIKWKEINDTYFRRQPGLYIIPKSENNFLIPYTNSLAPLSNPQPSIMPRSTMPVLPNTVLTEVPIIMPTVTSTSTPVPNKP